MLICYFCVTARSCLHSKSQSFLQRPHFENAPLSPRGETVPESACLHDGPGCRLHLYCQNRSKAQLTPESKREDAGFSSPASVAIARDTVPESQSLSAKLCAVCQLRQFPHRRR